MPIIYSGANNSKLIRPKEKSIYMSISSPFKVLSSLRRGLSWLGLLKFDKPITNSQIIYVNL
jgi:hypothetical protein